MFTNVGTAHSTLIENCEKYQFILFSHECATLGGGFIEIESCSSTWAGITRPYQDV
jgi:hypothetical protein